jgi:hypothetical protein
LIAAGPTGTGGFFVLELKLRLWKVIGFEMTVVGEESTAAAVRLLCRSLPVREHAGECAPSAFPRPSRRRRERLAHPLQIAILFAAAAASLFAGTTPTARHVP